MGLVIFFKQSLRSFKKNWSVVSLIFAFLVIGVSLVAGLVSYLFNAHFLSVYAGFKNGSQDGVVVQNRYAWTDDADTPEEQNILFADSQKLEFKKFIGKPDALKTYNEDHENRFYSFLLKNEGYVQSFFIKRMNF